MILENLIILKEKEITMDLEISYEQTFPLVPRRRIVGRGYGQWPTLRKGVGFDFAGLRPYVSGDDVRRIDYKASARRSAFLGRSDFVIREHFAEATVQMVIVVDRAPSMAFFSEKTPWLSKPEVIAAAGAMIVDSAVKQKCLVGYLDFADWGRNRAHRPDDKEAFWRPPNSDRIPQRVKERNLTHPYFTAPEDNLTMAFEFLFTHVRDLQQESFVFLLSDFFSLPSKDLLARVISRWDVIPVLIQDRVVEASFPVWEGMLPIGIPVVDARYTKYTTVSLNGKDAHMRRHEHEKRFQRIIDTWIYFGIEPIVLQSAEPLHVREQFESWMRNRLLSRV